MARPLDPGIQTRIISTRLPAPSAQRIHAAARRAETTPAALLRAALAALANPAVRSAIARLAPEIRSALAPVMAMTDADSVMPPPNDRAELVLFLQLPAAASDDQILKAVQKILDAAKGGPPPDPVEEQYTAGLSDAALAVYRRIKDPAERARYVGEYRRSAKRSAVPTKARPAPKPAAKRSTPARLAATRETLCRHLGLDPAKVYGGEIRSKAMRVASGSPRMNSTPERAAALRAYLGLPAGCDDDRVNAMVFSLTAVPSTTPNPYLIRRAAK